MILIIAPSSEVAYLVCKQQAFIETMNNSDASKLIIVKIVHTIIWIFFNVVLFYMAYTVVVDKIDRFVWIGVGLIILEGIVLLIFNKMCPLTLVARKYSDSTQDNFDIYLPNWLAKHNKLIYTAFFILIVMGILYRIA